MDFMTKQLEPSICIKRSNSVWIIIIKLTFLNGTATKNQNICDYRELSRSNWILQTTRLFIYRFSKWASSPYYGS